MVNGNCDGVPVGVWGDNGVKTEDVDTGLPMLLALVVIADVIAAAAADVLLQLLLFAVVGVAGVEMAAADDAVDCGAVVAGSDCCC